MRKRKLGPAERERLLKRWESLKSRYGDDPDLIDDEEIREELCRLTGVLDADWEDRYRRAARRRPGRVLNA